MKPGDISRVIFPCPYGRERSKIAKGLGFKPEQVQDDMMDTVGDTGAAAPLMMLAAALQEAGPGEKILVASYGNGSDVLCFGVTEEITKASKAKGIKGFLGQRAELPNYEKYVVFKNMVSQETGIRGEFENYTPFTHLWRERRAIHGLVGSQCLQCGTPQFPPQRVCVNPECGAIDENEDYSFSDKKGAIFSFTADNLAYSIDPPAIYGLVDMEGDGRLFLDFTDCRLEDLKVGMPMEMSFRRKYYDDKRGIHEYFWKAVPAKAQES